VRLLKEMRLWMRQVRYDRLWAYTSMTQGASGMLHHHYPCLASMGIDTDFNDTLHMYPKRERKRC
jgi:hypothetical protein